MKKMFFLGLFFTSCVPVSQILSPLVPRNIETSTFFSEQNSVPTCQEFFYKVDGTLVKIKINDKYRAEFVGLPETIKITFQARQDDLVLCVQSEASSIPDVYNVLLNIVHKEYINLRGYLKINVIDGRLIKFFEQGDSYIVKPSGKTCFPISTRQNIQSAFTKADGALLDLKFSTKAKVAISIENTMNPLCFTPESDALLGSYIFNARGFINGIGVNNVLGFVIQ